SRGVYVWLRSRVPELPRSAFKGPSPDNGDVGRTVYVALEPRGPVHEVTAASLRREALALAPGQHLLVGRLTYAAAGRDSGLPSGRYGIGRYYVPEGEGGGAVPPGGRAFPTGLYVDGKPYP